MDDGYPTTVQEDHNDLLVKSRLAGAAPANSLIVQAILPHAGEHHK